MPKRYLGLYSVCYYYHSLGIDLIQSQLDNSTISFVWFFCYGRFNLSSNNVIRAILNNDEGMGETAIAENIQFFASNNKKDVCHPHRRTLL